MSTFIIQRKRPGDKRPWYWSGTMSWTTDPRKAKKLSGKAAMVRLKKTSKWDSCKTDRAVSLMEVAS